MIIQTNENYKIFDKLSSLMFDRKFKEIKNIIEQSDFDISYEDEKTGWDILSLAVYTGFDKAVLYLINQGMDPMKKNKDGSTPLLLAVSGVGGIEVLKTILNYAPNIDVNQPNKKGYTPVMSACCQEDGKYLELLMKFQPDFERKDLSGKTALDYAIKSNNDFAKVLIEKQVFNEKIILNQKLEKKIFKI